jgi:hypothetical protein
MVKTAVKSRKRGLDVSRLPARLRRDLLIATAAARNLDVLPEGISGLSELDRVEARRHCLLIQGAIMVCSGRSGRKGSACLPIR